jgi:hypothetical protein
VSRVLQKTADSCWKWRAFALEEVARLHAGGAVIRIDRADVTEIAFGGAAGRLGMMTNSFVC